MNIINEKDLDKYNIPDLEVYIVNLHCPKQRNPPTDHDGVRGRLNDIVYGDRNSRHDEEFANLATDYKELITKIMKLSDEAISKIDSIKEKERLRKKLTTS